jgi:hypothetical protein
MLLLKYGVDRRNGGRRRNGRNGREGGDGRYGRRMSEPTGRRWR